MSEPGDPPLVRAETEATPVTIDLQQRRVSFYLVSEEELDALGSFSNSVNLTFFGITSGGLVSFLIVILTVSSGHAFFPIFVALLAVSSILFGYFGIRAWIDRGRSRSRVEQIKRSRRPPS